MRNFESELILFLRIKSSVWKAPCALGIGWKYGMLKIIKQKIKLIIAIIINFNSFNLRQKRISYLNQHYYYSRHRRLYNYFPNVETRIEKVFSTYGISKKLTSEINNLPVIDIGANIGEFSLFLKIKLKHKGELIAFEPDPTEFAVLQKNARIHGFTAVSKAVSGANGEVKFALKNDDADSRILFTENVSEKTIKVDAVTLEKELTSQGIYEVGLVKVEAEGYEPEPGDPSATWRESNL